MESKKEGEKIENKKKRQYERTDEGMNKWEGKEQRRN